MSFSLLKTMVTSDRACVARQRMKIKVKITKYKCCSTIEPDNSGVYLG